MSNIKNILFIIENINRLKEQLNDLQLENQILKNILDNAGISYRKEIISFRASEELCDFDINQGKRIQFPPEISDKMAVMCYSRFWGRQDVYAKRSVKKIREKLATFHNAIIFGLKIAAERKSRILVVMNVNLGHIKN